MLHPIGPPHNRLVTGTFWLLTSQLFLGILHAQPANIVLIVADDAGYVDFGFQGSSVIPTPNLDRLASRGVRFTNAYIQSVCSPSRAILATGLYGGRFGYEQNIPSDSSVIGSGLTIGLSPSQTTIFDRMKLLGYRTLAVGKWHLGFHADDTQGQTLLAPGNRPSQQGIDQFFGLLGGSRPYFIGSQTSASNRLITESLGSNGIVQQTIVESDFDGQYVTDVIGEQTANYISENFQSGPFYIVSSFTAPHTPMQAKLEDLATIDGLNLGLSGNRRIYAAMQFAMDRAIGSIMDRLDDPDNDGDTQDSIADQTLVIFVNDNGGDCCDGNTNSSFNGVLRNGKGSIWEGGIRVPMLMAGAGIDALQEGTDYDAPVHAIDIAATCYAAGGGNAEPDFFDGVDLLPYINQVKTGDPHEIVYIRRPSSRGLACRAGNFKLYHDRNVGFALFDLSTNPGENLGNNLIDQFPQLVSDLKHRVTEFDVQFVKRGWNIDNIGIDQFRFREGAFAQANWDAANGWTNLSDDNGDGQQRLQSDDGTSSTHLVFRAKNGGDFVATNNLTRANGLEFMANQIEFVTRPEGLNGSRLGIIDGLPVMLTHAPNGAPATIKLNSFDGSPNTMTFDWQTDVLLYDDLIIQGNGNDVYIFSGSLREYRPTRNITKMGNASLHLSGSNELSGTIEVREGQIGATISESLGTANLLIQSGGTIEMAKPLELAGERVVAGFGTLAGDLISNAQTSPGDENETGVLTITGNFTQTSGGQLSICVDGIDQFDQLLIQQDASLAGSLSIDTKTKVAAGTELQIVPIDGSIVGAFDSIENTGTASWLPEYRGDGVWIVAQATKETTTPVDSISISNGLIEQGTTDDLVQSDDLVLAIRADQPEFVDAPPIEFEVMGVAPAQVNSLRIEIEIATATPNLELNIEAFNFTTNQYEKIDPPQSLLLDQELVVEITSAADFIEPGTNQIQARIYGNSIGPTLMFPWSFNLDRLVWISTSL